MNVDRVKQNITAGGTGNLTLGTAVAGYRTAASASNAEQGFLSYAIEWASGWETGIGQLSGDGLTLTRTIPEASSTGSVPVNVPASGATFSITPNASALQAHGGRLVSWASAVGAVSFGGVADQPDMRKYASFLNGGERIEWDLNVVTSNATPTDAFADADTVRPTIPAGQVWLVRAFVVGVVSNSPGAIGNCYARELRALGKPTGQIGATVSTAIASDAGFTGSATMTINASGQVKVTVTGIAANDINWSISLDITPAFAS